MARHGESFGIAQGSGRLHQSSKGSRERSLKRAASYDPGFLQRYCACSRGRLCPADHKSGPSSTQGGHCGRPLRQATRDLPDLRAGASMLTGASMQRVCTASGARAALGPSGDRCSYLQARIK